jgi:hypothetical protein
MIVFDLLLVLVLLLLMLACFGIRNQIDGLHAVLEAQLEEAKARPVITVSRPTARRPRHRRRPRFRCRGLPDEPRCSNYISRGRGKGLCSSCKFWDKDPVPPTSEEIEQAKCLLRSELADGSAKDTQTLNAKAEERGLSRHALWKASRIRGSTIIHNRTARGCGSGMALIRG